MTDLQLLTGAMLTGLTVGALIAAARIVLPNRGRR